MHKYLLTSIVLASIVVASVLIVGTAAAGSTATERPFQGVAVGVTTFADDESCPFAFRTTAESSGVVTHLGNVEVENGHCFAGVDEVTGEGLLEAGVLTLTAANGDVLRGSYSGIAVPAMPENVGDVVVAEIAVSVSGGTGRFVGATGAIDLTAYVTFPGWEEPGWPTRLVFDGWISY